jgi:hypothetical protein
MRKVVSMELLCTLPPENTLGAKDCGSAKNHHCRDLLVHTVCYFHNNMPIIADVGF